MTTDERIRLALTGDDGRAVRRCETCGGQPLVRTGNSYEHFDQSDFAVCPDCTNGWAEDREGIAAAVIEASKTVAGVRDTSLWHQLICPPRDTPPKQRQSYMETAALREWDRRDSWSCKEALEGYVIGKTCPNCDGGKRRMGHPVGQPSCSQCNGTGHIGGWREAAPKYDSPPGMVLLKAALREAGWAINSELTADVAIVHVFRPGDEMYAAASRESDTEWSALFNAVDAATGGSDA